MVENFIEYKRKYETFRHHAWAGLGLLSVFLAINYFISLPQSLSLVVVSVLSIYIIAALLATYRYKKGLLAKEKPVQPSIELEKEKLKTEVEKAQFKAEKKKIKAEVKMKKKADKEK